MLKSKRSRNLGESGGYGTHLTILAFHCFFKTMESSCSERYAFRVIQPPLGDRSEG
jgi:hypothetical protein